MRSSRAMTGSILLCCALALLALSGSACSSQSKVKADKVEAVSVDVEPRVEPFSTTPVPTPLLPRVPSRGDCAPRYANGTLGTCVNDKPCRGFGVLDGSRVICACFVKRGGCEQDERCEARESRCVKDAMPEFNIIP